MEKNRLSDVLKKHQLLVEYNFYLPTKDVDEQELPGGETPDAGADIPPPAGADTPPTGADTPPVGGDEPPIDVPAPTEPTDDAEPAMPQGTPDVPSPDTAPPSEPSPNADGEVELDITDLVNSTKDTKEKIEGTNELLNNLMTKFDDFDSKMSSFDQILGRIDKLEQDLDKRLPTPVEKMEMRSMDSFPYSLKLSDFWNDESNAIEGDEAQSNAGTYTLTTDDVKKDYNALDVKSSFDAQGVDDEENKPRF